MLSVLFAKYPTSKVRVDTDVLGKQPSCRHLFFNAACLVKLYYLE